VNQSKVDLPLQKDLHSDLNKLVSDLELTEAQHLALASLWEASLLPLQGSGMLLSSTYNYVPVSSIPTKDIVEGLGEKEGLVLNN